MNEQSIQFELRYRQRFTKRTFDIVFSSMGLLAASWLIVLAYLVACLDTGTNGLFSQQRVGRGGRFFRLYKIRTMQPRMDFHTSVTTARDPRVTRVGHFLRRTKIDELPQLWNVLVGDMSFVGPRPDVPGFADQLEGEAKLILSVRPGITGPATLRFRREEELLAEQSDPEAYNRDTVYPEKVRLNIQYIRNWCLTNDIRLIWHTLLS